MIKKPLVRVVSFTVFYILVFIASALVSKNHEFLFYNIEIVLLLGLLSYVHSRVNFTFALLWSLSIWGFLHLAGGLVPVSENLPICGESRVLYNLWLVPGKLKYDQVIHAYGFGITTWACWQAMQSFWRSMGKQLEATAGKLILVAAAGMGFGALNEVVEFLMVLFLPNTNVGD